jgi:membrane-associated phospholipid phosphatase
VDCPHHAAFPSGHSTQSHLVALAMGEVTGRDDIRQALWQAADRIAENREYAGLHYASDSACGAELARQLLPHFVREHAGAIAKARQEEWG